MTIRAALADATARLQSMSETPRLDAELLMAHALGTERDAMLLAGQNDPVPESFEPLIARRLAGEPVAYITGRRAFWTIELEVAPGVLIPRPDSETLIEAALDHFGSAGPRTILDLGTGPGTLLLAALDQWAGAQGLGVDRSAQALAIAKGNAERLGLGTRADFRQGNWAAGIEEQFDLVLCNPPYVETEAELMADVREWEPAEALFAGADGLDDYRALAPQIGSVLKPGGIACIELGAGQAETVAALFTRAGFHVAFRNDLGGHARCLILRID